MFSLKTYKPSIIPLPPRALHDKLHIPDRALQHSRYMCHDVIKCDIRLKCCCCDFMVGFTFTMTKISATFKSLIMTGFDYQWLMMISLKLCPVEKYTTFHIWIYTIFLDAIMLYCNLFMICYFTDSMLSQNVFFSKSHVNHKCGYPIRYDRIDICICIVNHSMEFKLQVHFHVNGILLFIERPSYRWMNHLFTRCKLCGT